MKGSSFHLAHQPAGDAGCVSGPETLSPRPKRSPCVGAHRQHRSGLLCQPLRRSAVAPPVLAGAPDPCVVLASASFIPEADAGFTAHAFVPAGHYVTSPVTYRPSYGQISLVFRAGYTEGVPLVSSNAATHSLEELGLHM